MNETAYRMNPMNDYVFKLMHYYDIEKGKKIFASLTEACTGLEVTNVHFEPTELYPENVNSKDVRMDLSARVDTKTEIDLEMQLHHMESVKERAAYNMAAMYTTKENKGKTYAEHIGVHCIFLCSKTVFKETEEHETHFELMDKRTGILLTEKMKAHIIELNKAVESVKEEDDITSLNLLQKWAMFLMGYADEDKREVIEQLEESDGVFRLAAEVLEMVSDDKLARDKAIARERYLKDQAQLAWEVEQNMKKQYEQGFQEGTEKGRSEAQLLMIEEMLQDNVNDQIIMKYAHCTLKQIEQVKEMMEEGKRNA